jgi:biotin carboxylase
VTGDRRPVLAIVVGEGFGSAMQMWQSASPLCDIAWVMDSSMMTESTTPRLLHKLGAVVDIAGMCPDDAADALRAAGPDGIVTYGDHLIPTTAALACRLGLDYHDDVVTPRLIDKLDQRRALRDGGVPVPRFGLLGPCPSSREIDAVVSEVGFPAVVKPRRGAASRDTVLVHDAQELGAAVCAPDAASGETSAPVVVEEYFVGATPAPSRCFADYVTVESVVAHGHISHVAVAGRFPPAPPFRESGFFISSDFSLSDKRIVLDVATAAITALGVRTGFLNTEVKMTTCGPRVIEVNGRLGGSAPSIMNLAADVDLAQLSQRVALGEEIVFDDLLPTGRVGYLFFVQAPQWAHHVLSVDGLDRVGAHPGVDTVFLNRMPGSDIDWHKGSHEYVFSVLGATPDHEGLLELKRFIDEEVTVAYS